MRVSKKKTSQLVIENTILCVLFKINKGYYLGGMHSQGG